MKSSKLWTGIEREIRRRDRGIVSGKRSVALIQEFSLKYQSRLTSDQLAELDRIAKSYTGALNGLYDLITKQMCREERRRKKLAKKYREDKKNA